MSGVPAEMGRPRHVLHEEMREKPNSLHRRARITRWILPYVTVVAVKAAGVFKYVPSTLCTKSPDVPVKVHQICSPLKDVY